MLLSMVADPERCHALSGNVDGGKGAGEVTGARVYGQ